VTAIPFFAASREYATHREAIETIIGDCLVTGRVLQGDPVGELEADVAEYVGRRHAIAVNSGTDALFFAVMAAGISPGDEVIVPDMSFVATASSVVRAGGVPQFADVDATGNLDLDSAASLARDLTRAVIVVDLYGRMLDPRRAEAFARDHNLILIEDAAQAFGATFQGRRAGSIGAASCFSFDPTKPLGAPGSGGMVVTDSDDIAERVRRLRYHGKGRDGRFVEIGYNSQLPSLTAAVLRFKLDLNEEWMARRREIARIYIQELSDLPVNLLEDDHTSAAHIFHKFVVRARDRDGLRTQLSETGIPTMIHYAEPLHTQPCFRGVCGHASTPVAEALSREVISLPIHPFLEDGEVELVTGAMRDSLALRTPV
jgi:dTDP-4-amino-4,6-dideoxygalactose transaminase